MDEEKWRRDQLVARYYSPDVMGIGLIIAGGIVGLAIFLPLTMALSGSDVGGVIALGLMILFMGVCSGLIMSRSSAAKSKAERQADAELEARRKTLEDVIASAKKSGFVFSRMVTNAYRTACLAIDTEHHRFLVKEAGMPHHILEYKQLASYELYKDGKSVIAGDATKALAGGILFGTVGAVIGAAGTSHNIDAYSSDMYVSIVDDSAHRYKLYLIYESVDQSSPVYQKSNERARDMLSMLSAISSVNSKTMANTTLSVNTENPAPVQPSVTNQSNVKTSEADEIMKFKELLDKGVITQEEFDAKKKQLLGL